MLPHLGGHQPVIQQPLGKPAVVVARAAVGALLALVAQAHNRVLVVYKPPLRALPPEVRAQQPAGVLAHPLRDGVGGARAEGHVLGEALGEEGEEEGEVGVLGEGGGDDVEREGALPLLQHVEHLQAKHLLSTANRAVRVPSLEGTPSRVKWPKRALGLLLVK